MNSCRHDPQRLALSEGHSEIMLVVGGLHTCMELKLYTPGVVLMIALYCLIKLAI
jgi:hypothetical protein